MTPHRPLLCATGQRITTIDRSSARSGAGRDRPGGATGTGSRLLHWYASSLLLLLLACSAAPAMVVKIERIERINPPSMTLQAPMPGGSPAISADGHLVAFVAPEGYNEVFLCDRQTGTMELVSVAASGDPADSDCSSPSLSADGQFVAFVSDADNLAPGDTNGTPDIFVRDRQTGTTELVSVGLNGLPANGYRNSAPTVSADGRFVAFSSDADNLAPGETDGYVNIYVRDRHAGMTERVSVTPAGAPADADSGSPAISGDGRYIAFSSGADDLVPGGTNGATNIYVRDRQTGTTEQVGAGVSPALSADGRFVTFWSDGTTLAPGNPNVASGLFLRDRRTGTIERVGVGTSIYYPPRPRFGGGCGGGVPPPPPVFAAPAAISADGRFVAFESDTDNLSAAVWPGNSALCIYLRDRQRGRTEKLSIVASGMPADGGTGAVGISADGRSIAFESAADNPVPGDPNGTWDVLVFERHWLTVEVAPF